MKSQKKYKNFYNSSKINPSLYSIQEKIKLITKKVIDNELVFNLQSTIIKALPCDASRTVMEAIPDHSGALAIRNLIFNSILSAEAISRGSGWLFECDVSGLINQEKNLDILKFSKSTEEELQKVLSSNIGDGYIHKIINEIIKITDFNIDIKCFSHEGENFGIDIKSFKNFNLRMHDLFGINNFNLEKSYVIYFDGQIEKIEEIESLIKFLNKNELKDCVLIARNFHENVVSTLKINYDLKKFKIYPCVDLLEDTKLFDYCKNEKNILFVDLENISVFNNIHNNINLNVFKDISLKNNLILFLNEKNNNKIKKDVKVFVPKKFENCIGIIEDRLKFAIIISEQTCKSGVVKLNIDNKEFWTTKLSFNTYIKTKKSFLNILNNLGGIII